MTLWIDEPIWPAHGRLFAHLVSDANYEELHRFAIAQGLHPRSFDGDHYDVPKERWPGLVAAGATPTTGVDLVRRLNASGLRLRKRKGDRGLVRHLDLPLPTGAGDIDLVLSPRAVDETKVFGAMVFVRDAQGAFAAVYSIRREQWGSPGGGRELGESPLQNAVREAREETGLRVEPERVIACGYERFTPRTPGTEILTATTTSSHHPTPTSTRYPIAASTPYLQVYRTQLDQTAPPLTDGDSGIRETRWVSPREYAALCGTLFWWPLAVAIFADLDPDPR